MPEPRSYVDIAICGHIYLIWQNGHRMAGRPRLLGLAPSVVDRKAIPSALSKHIICCKEVIYVHSDWRSQDLDAREQYRGPAIHVCADDPAADYHCTDLGTFSHEGHIQWSKPWVKPCTGSTIRVCSRAVHQSSSGLFLGSACTAPAHWFLYMYIFIYIHIYIHIYIYTCVISIYDVFSLCYVRDSVCVMCGNLSVLCVGFSLCYVQSVVCVMCSL